MPDAGARTPRHRLSPHVRAKRVRLDLELDPAHGDAFRGRVEIDVELARPLRSLRLHAADLRVSRPRVDAGRRRLRPRLTPLPHLEMIELAFEQTIPAGCATLQLSFSGRLRSDLRGLYGVEAGARRYAFTQLEVTDARRFFPCFDEPSQKARFRVSVTTGAANRVVSNAPEEGREALADGRHLVRFRETPPLSTYLLALAVGELESTSPMSVGPTEIRVWHVPGQSHLTGFGLETARECLTRLERYFGVPYPYGKLDLLAVPNFWAFGMENAAAVFFREDMLLVDGSRATVAERRQAAVVICHELSQMWFGDLVTMAWWDDLWLNEAFATWMAHAILDEWRPEWQVWNDFQHDRASAFELDALRNTHPVYCPVRKPADAVENFDHITYNKGAALVRMIERYLGARAFRRGVRLYIRRHREGNAAAVDLWRALSEASGQDVGRIARAWMEQKGHPVVHIRRGPASRSGELQLRQERFLARPARRRPDTTNWPIPWVARVGRRGRPRIERHLVTRARQRVRLGEGEIRFIYGNADEAGFFRPCHGPRELEALRNSLTQLTVVERMGLVDHQWALARSGHAPLGSVLDLAEALGDEEDPNVLAVLRKPMGFLVDALIPDAAPRLDEPFRAWLAGRYAPAFRQLGWQPHPDEDDDRRRRRAALLALAGCVGRARDVVAEAGERCDAYLADRQALDANLADAVVAMAADLGDAIRHETFLKAAITGTPQERRRFLLALADFRKPRLVKATLSLIPTDQVPNQEVLAVLTRLLENPAGRGATWEFLTRRWARIRERLPDFQARLLIEKTPALLTPAYRREVKAFFRRNPVLSGERTLRQAMERFDWYRGFRRPAVQAIETWLAARGLVS